MEGYWKPQPDSSWRCTTIGQKTVDTSRRVRNSPTKEKKKITMRTDKHWASRLPKGWEISILEDSKKLDEARSTHVVGPPLSEELD